MRVLYCHKVRDANEHECLASVDFELNEHIRLYGLRLLRKPDGNMFLYAPQAGHRRTATFSAPMAKRLTALAVEAYEAASNDQR
ncbi:hypothetical protein ACC795_12350 [Rhizobium ruizarguesonis]